MAAVVLPFASMEMGSTTFLMTKAVGSFMMVRLSIDSSVRHAIHFHLYPQLHNRSVDIKLCCADLSAIAVFAGLIVLVSCLQLGEATVAGASTDDRPLSAAF